MLGQVLYLTSSDEELSVKSYVAAEQPGDLILPVLLLVRQA